MIISARRVAKPRTTRFCSMCHQMITGQCLGLYGASDPQDRPYRIWIHEACAHPDTLRHLNRPKKAKAP